MAAARKFAVSNCLCFLSNKIGNIAAKSLKTLLLEFYSTEEVADAKDILLRELDDLKFANIPKIARRRRDSTGNKSALDIEDLFTLLVFCDENRYSSQLPLFVATHSDKMPSVRITTGDLELIWSKLEKL